LPMPVLPRGSCEPPIRSCLAERLCTRISSIIANEFHGSGAARARPRLGMDCSSGTFGRGRLMARSSASFGRAGHSNRFCASACRSARNPDHVDHPFDGAS
jgi:hypothetical protein